MEVRYMCHWIWALSLFYLFWNYSTPSTPFYFIKLLPLLWNLVPWLLVDRAQSSYHPETLLMNYLVLSSSFDFSWIHSSKLCVESFSSITVVHEYEIFGIWISFFLLTYTGLFIELVSPRKRQNKSKKTIITKKIM